MGLKDPHRFVQTVHGGGSLPFVTIFRMLLPFPCFRRIIMQPNAVVEVPGQSADHILVARIGIAKSAGGKPAKEYVGCNENDRFSHFFFLDGSRHRSRGDRKSDVWGKDVTVS